MGIYEQNTTFAKEQSFNQNSEKIFEKYGVQSEEILNLEKNLKTKLEDLGEIDRDLYNIPVSENIYADIKTETVNIPSVQFNEIIGLPIPDSDLSAIPFAAASYNKTYSTTIELKNYLGMTIVTLTGSATFRVNGTSCRPLDAYGTYTGFVWDISIGQPYKSAGGASSFVRMNFNGKCDIGIDPVNMRLQTFSYAVTINCLGNGKCTSSWA